MYIYIYYIYKVIFLTVTLHVNVNMFLFTLVSIAVVAPNMYYMIMYFQLSILIPMIQLSKDVRGCYTAVFLTVKPFANGSHLFSAHM